MTDEPRIKIGSLQIQRRVILAPGADDIAFSVEIDSTAHHDDIFDLMDTISAVSDRELAKAERAANIKQVKTEQDAALRQMKADLAQREKSLEAAQAMPRQKDMEIAQLIASRHAYVSIARAAHERRGRRGEFKFSEKQITDMEKFDTSIAAARQSKISEAAHVPLIEWEIAALRARLAGEEPPPRPVDLFDAAIADLGQVATA